MRLISTLFLLALIAVFPAQAETGKKIQCWSDKSGNRMCGDRVPPEYAGEKREVIKDGRVIETKRGAKTPEEIAEEERKKVEAEEAKKRADYDRALLESYRNVKDIENMRDERLVLLDMRIMAAEKSATENEKALKDLGGREAAAAATSKAKDGAVKPADAKLAKQIRQFEKALAADQKSLARLKSEREQTEQKFAADEKRYNELRPPAPKKTSGG